MEYAYKEINDNMARVFGRSLNISTKQSVEICRTLRGMNSNKAIKLLLRVIAKEDAIRMHRYNRDTAHKRNIGAGKYPIKAAKEIIQILESAEANAQNKGLSTKDLKIVHISAHKASRQWHYGRKKRSVMKKTHIQVVVLEEKVAKKVEEKKEIKK